MECNVTIRPFWEIINVGSVYRLRVYNYEKDQTVGIMTATKKPYKNGNFLFMPNEKLNITKIFFIDNDRGVLTPVCNSDKVANWGNKLIFEYEGIYYLWDKEYDSGENLHFDNVAVWVKKLGKPLCSSELFNNCYLVETASEKQSVQTLNHVFLSFVDGMHFSQKEVQHYEIDPHGVAYLMPDGSADRFFID